MRFRAGRILFVCLALLLAPHAFPEARAQEESFDDELGNYLVNVAYTAGASSSYANGCCPASAVVNRDRRGAGWGAGTGGWNDGTPNQFPDSIEIHFNGEKAIEEVDLYTVQDDYLNPAEPTEDMTFSLYGIVDFDVKYWDSSASQWVLLGGARGNNKVWWQLRFPTVTTSKLSISVLKSVSIANTNSYSRITEVEAWGREAIQLVTEPLGPPDPTDSNPCDGKTSTPCAPTISLHDAIKGDPLRYKNYPNMLDWNFKNWTDDTSKNLPALAHAVTLWRPRSEWDKVAGSDPDPVQWWRDFLNCQVGDPACPAGVPSKLRHMKADELLANTYDADTLRAVVSVFHWASREMVQGRGTAAVTDLAYKARLYMWKTWGMYGLGAGYGPAQYLTHYSNRNLSPADKRCQRNANKYWFTGPFMALAGTRSPWGHQCQEDRGPLFLRALSPEWPDALPANAPADLRTAVKERETSAQWGLLDLIEARRKSFNAEPNYAAFPYKDENAYALSPGLRAFFVNHIVSGGGSETIRGFLQGTKLLVEYHFLGWIDSAGKQVRLTVMRENPNSATIPTYAVLYKSSRTAEAMIPFLQKQITIQEYINWQKTQPNSGSIPERAPETCFKGERTDPADPTTHVCYWNKDVSEDCYKSVKDLGNIWAKCWTRQERNPGITVGYALLLNNSSETASDPYNPTRLKVSNLKDGEFPNVKHGRIVEWIKPLDIQTKLYHVAYLPSAGTWVQYW